MKLLLRRKLRCAMERSVQTSDLPVRASSGCLFITTTEIRGFATGRVEVCPTEYGAGAEGGGQ